MNGKWFLQILLLTALVAGITASVQAADESSLSAQAVRAYVTNFGGNGISVVDPVRGVLVANIATGEKPHGVAIAPNGRAVYVSNEGSGTVSVIDPATNKVTATWKAGALKVGPSPKRLAVGRVVQ